MAIRIRLLTVRDLCRRLQVSRTTFYARRAQLGLPEPVTKVWGDRLPPRWRSDQIDDWMASLGERKQGGIA